MQLQSIDQVKDLMDVWHPIYGKGEIVDILPIRTPFIDVKFEKWKGCENFKIFFYEDSIENDITQLYTSPVTVIAESEVTRLRDLVKAQEELIDWLRPYTPYVHRDVGYLKDMTAKINQLQSKTDK